MRWPNRSLTSKSFDYGTACVAEQAVIADRPIVRELRNEMKLRGAYFCTRAESDRLAELLFTDDLAIHPDHVGQSAARLAELSGFDLPPNTRVLICEETEVGRNAPLSAEKLNPVLAWYEPADVAQGLALADQVVRFGGWGHSAAIHCDDPEVVAEYGRLPACRVIVNTPTLAGGMGFSTDLEPSFMLGTGTSSGSIVSDNVTALPPHQHQADCLGIAALA